MTCYCGTNHPRDEFTMCVRVAIPRPDCPDCSGYQDAHEPECPRYVEPETMPDWYERKTWREESED